MLVTAMVTPHDDRRRDAGRTRSQILGVATTEFARRGFDGVRVDEIAARTRTTKRMIYYYFGGKEQLYQAVLEQAVVAIRLAQPTEDDSCPDPLTIVRWIAERTFDQYQAHPDAVRLVVGENLHEARHLSTSTSIARGDPGLDRLRRALADGARQGSMRSGADALDVHLVISSYCAYPIANRFTHRFFTDHDLLDPTGRARQRTLIGDLVVAYLSPV
jgi:AcrR family transcriptional regulator